MDLAVCVRTDKVDTTDSSSFRVSRPAVVIRTQPPSYPALSLLGQIGLGYCLIQPLELTLSVDELGQIIIGDDIFFVYGVGGSIQEAIQDYKVSLIEFYELHEGHTDRPTIEKFEFIKTYIQKN